MLEAYDPLQLNAGDVHAAWIYEGRPCPVQTALTAGDDHFEMWVKAGVFKDHPASILHGIKVMDSFSEPLIALRARQNTEVSVLHESSPITGGRRLIEAFEALAARNLRKDHLFSSMPITLEVTKSSWETKRPSHRKRTVLMIEAIVVHLPEELFP